MGKYASGLSSHSDKVIFVGSNPTLPTNYKKG